MTEGFEKSKKSGNIGSVVSKELWMVVMVLMNAHHQVDMVDQVDDLGSPNGIHRYKYISSRFQIPMSSVVLGKVVYGIFFFNWNRGRSIFFVSEIVRKDFLIKVGISQNEYLSPLL